MNRKSPSRTERTKLDVVRILGTVQSTIEPGALDLEIVAIVICTVVRPCGHLVVETLAIAVIIVSEIAVGSDLVHLNVLEYVARPNDVVHVIATVSVVAEVALAHLASVIVNADQLDLVLPHENANMTIHHPNNDPALDLVRVQNQRRRIKSLRIVLLKRKPNHRLQNRHRKAKRNELLERR